MVSRASRPQRTTRAACFVLNILFALRAHCGRDARDPIFDARDPIFDARDPMFDACDPMFDARDPMFDARDTDVRRPRYRCSTPTIPILTPSSLHGPEFPTNAFVDKDDCDQRPSSQPPGKRSPRLPRAFVE